MRRCQEFPVIVLSASHCVRLCVYGLLQSHMHIVDIDDSRLSIRNLYYDLAHCMPALMQRKRIFDALLSERERPLGVHHNLELALIYHLHHFLQHLAINTAQERASGGPRMLAMCHGCFAVICQSLSTTANQRPVAEKTLLPEVVLAVRAVRQAFTPTAQSMMTLKGGSTNSSNSHLHACMRPSR
jgi:hypothetical protein